MRADFGTIRVGARQAVIDVDALSIEAERGQSVALRGEILFFGGHAGVSDQQSDISSLHRLRSIQRRTTPASATD